MSSIRDTTTTKPTAPVDGVESLRQLMREQQRIIQTQQQTIEKMEKRLKQQQAGEIEISAGQVNRLWNENQSQFEGEQQSELFGAVKTDIREYVTHRKLSGKTRSESGRTAGDTSVVGLNKTCRKLGIVQNSRTSRDQITKLFQWSSSICLVAGGVIVASNTHVSSYGFIFLVMSSSQMLFASIRARNTMTIVYAGSLFFVDCLGIYRWILK